jgi:hypothetical protein
MRLAHFRVRTLMIAVGVVALLVWGAMMSSRSYDYYRRAREYGSRERGWREIAARGRWDARFASECTEYFGQLAGKYRRAMWRPWMAVTPDPHAPGFDLWLEQERRAKEAMRGPTSIRHDRRHTGATPPQKHIFPLTSQISYSFDRSR